VTLPSRSVCLYVDGAQNPGQLERGIGRYVSEHARALDTLAPSLLHSVLVNPGLSLTGNLSPFLGKGRLVPTPGIRVSEGHRGDPPRVYHIMSPFEATTSVDVMWPLWARDPRIVTVITLYDLIPLIFPDQYLRTADMRAFYSGRVELIRHVDGILALSRHTAQDAVERLEVSPDRVHVIEAGANELFAEMYRSPEAAWAHISRNLEAIRPGFLLYVGGADFRKNMEGTIAGFSRLPAALRANHQMVIVGILNPGQAEFLRAEADRVGIGSDELVLTGHVSDADLGALYHACTLFVFPSLYEGFGLPILEAMSCGAPVAASTTTSVPEVLGDMEGTFEPHDPDSIASCLAAILRSPDLLERLRARSHRRAAECTWQRVAEQSIEAYERVAARPWRRRSRRARLALVTPWPPDQSRVSDYNLRLATELGQRVDLDVVVGQPVDRYPDPRELGVNLIDARHFDQLRPLRQYDRVLYCMGNSKLYRHVYELLTRRPGPVVLHDVRMTDFYRWYAGVEHPEDPERAVADRIQAMYGLRLPQYATQHGMPGWGVQAALGIYMTRELQGYADQCFVHSRAARDVLNLDRGPSDRPAPVSLLPFGMPPAVDAWHRDAGSGPLIVSFGDVHEVSSMATIINAFELLAVEVPSARFVITGHVDPDPRRRPSRASINFLGNVGPEWHTELLRTADLAVHLRLPADDQAPTLLADCLANGVPTIATDLWWAGDLPATVVEKVPSTVTPQELKHRILRLLDEPGRLAGLSRGGLDCARNSSFAAVADAYLDALGLVLK
jgi:glycosyltransferase involved in cell wall biosynthesis